MYSSYDNTMLSYSTRHMQVYFVLQKELLQTGIVELDTLFPLLTLLFNAYAHQMSVEQDIDLAWPMICYNNYAFSAVECQSDLFKALTNIQVLSFGES